MARNALRILLSVVLWNSASSVRVLFLASIMLTNLNDLSRSLKDSIVFSENKIGVFLNYDY
jgi:hypothetical protein